MPSATTSDIQHHLFMEKVFHGIDWTAYTNIYVGLFITLPALSDATGGLTGTEVDTAGTNYARVAVPVGSGNWTVSGLEYSNTADITYGVPSANWGNIIGAALFDAATLGNLLYTAPLTTAKQVSDGDGAPKILANQLRITRAVC